MLGSRMQSSKVTKAFEIEIVNNKINIVTSYFKRCLEALRKWYKRWEIAEINIRKFETWGAKIQEL